MPNMYTAIATLKTGFLEQEACIQNLHFEGKKVVVGICFNKTYKLGEQVINDLIGALFLESGSDKLCSSAKALWQSQKRKQSL